MQLLGQMLLLLTSSWAYPDPALNVTCTSARLAVEFTNLGKSQRYASAMMCGTLFLQPEIQEQPLVTFQEAEPHALYTLLMIDPDDEISKSINHGNWPGPPGKVAPCRHWTVGNLPGSILKVGYTATAKSNEWVGQPYHGPGISYGTRRYGLFVFQQTGDRPIAFKPLNPNRCPWDYQVSLIEK